MADGSELVGRWRVAMRRRDLAPSTIAGRVATLRRFLGAHPDPFVVTDDQIDDWLDEIGHHGKTRYDTTSALSQFYRWSIRGRLTQVDPTVTVERPRLKPGLPRPIHETDLTIALLHARGDPCLEVALWFAAGSGMRCCEIARLRWDDVHGEQARIIGKGTRVRVVPLAAQALAAMDDISRTSVYVLDGWQSGGKSPGLKVSQRGNSFLHSLGVSSTMHTLRHYAASMAYQRGGRDLRAVQELLGHASPATTAIYAALDTEALRPLVNSIPLPERLAS